MPRSSSNSVSKPRSPRDRSKVAKKSTVRRAGTVALVGRSNVGKSTLMNALLGEALVIVASSPQTTRDRILGVVHHRDAQLVLLDTPGLHKPRTRLGKRMNSSARGAAEEANVVLFVTAPPPIARGPLGAHEGDRTLLQDIGKTKPTLLVLNKVDTIRPRERMLSLLEELTQLRDFAAVVPIAAKNRDGLDRLLDEVIKLLPVQGALYPADTLTDRPIRFFAAEFIREEILRVARDELPYAIAVTIDTFQEEPTITKIAATIHVERDGQRGIILGRGGLQLKQIGTAARARIEDMHGGKVHLALFVRVTPDWTQDTRTLADLGYTKDADEKPSEL